MKTKGLLTIALLFSSLVVLAPVCSAAADDASNPAPLAITHVTVVDVKNGALLPDQTVVMDNRRIVQVIPSGQIRLPQDTVVYDATGKFVIPGLWDMHVHLLDDEQIAFPYLLANGVTGIRDMGAPLEDVQRWRETLLDGTPAPHVFFAGPALDGARTLGDGSLMQVNLRSPEEARAEVDQLVQAGVDFIKVYTYLPDNVYKAIADEAKEQGIPFAGHVPFAVSAKTAAEMGQKSIEHLYGVLIASSSREAEIRKNYADHLSYIFAVDLEAAQSFDKAKAHALFETFANHDTHMVPTLVVYHNLLGPIDPALAQHVPTDIQKYWEDYQKQIKAKNPGAQLTQSVISQLYQIYPHLIDEMNRQGVPIMAGTDTLWHEKEPTPNLVFGFSLHDELELLVQAGLTPLEALQAATITPARFLGIENSSGSIEAGKWADLVLLDENPLVEIAHTRQIWSVISDGRYLDKQTLQGMLRTFPHPDVSGQTS
ncbi:amidohydrolase family protein [Brevibacillus fulvus]|uniref:Imidazolonepropionase-like amidohydrolase n=1 Tax=Brevibacillus fulvus TaxID=1125967 RepID=A0A939BNF7_9BACL|nr:amidohydrolase family protein [Brevibacillus fulvus]MBM7588975.1 imidazolonepropionase-like amidohydrolase [Brevibacillus fulvus]